MYFTTRPGTSFVLTYNVTVVSLTLPTMPYAFRSGRPPTNCHVRVSSNVYFRMNCVLPSAAYNVSTPAIVAFKSAKKKSVAVCTVTPL